MSIAAFLASIAAVIGALAQLVGVLQRRSTQRTLVTADRRRKADSGS